MTLNLGDVSEQWRNKLIRKHQKKKGRKFMGPTLALIMMAIWVAALSIQPNNFIQVCRK